MACGLIPASACSSSKWDLLGRRNKGKDRHCTAFDYLGRTISQCRSKMLASQHYPRRVDARAAQSRKTFRASTTEAEP